MLFRVIVTEKRWEGRIGLFLVPGAVLSLAEDVGAELVRDGLVEFHPASGADRYTTRVMRPGGES